MAEKKLKVGDPVKVDFGSDQGPKGATWKVTAVNGDGYNVQSSLGHVLSGIKHKTKDTPKDAASLI